MTAFSVGIGLTNECNLRCAHCYRSDMAIERLTPADVDALRAEFTARGRQPVLEAT